MQRYHVQLSAPDIGEDERRLVEEVLRSGTLSMGPMVEGFERAYAEKFGARHAIAVSSGTAGLHLSLIAAGVRDGDLVITTPFSFIATANVILYERATPLFVDIDPKTLTIDAGKAIAAIEEHARGRRLRAIIPVHLFGRTAEMTEIVAAARKHGVAIVEDACEAVGASAGGTFAGRWGDSGVFGFYPNKQMTTGEGGMILTDRDDWRYVLRSLRNHGHDDDARLVQRRLGYNYRLDEMSAALGLAQLRRLDALLAQREAIAQRYRSLLATNNWVEPLAPAAPGATLSWFVFVVRVDDAIDRDLLMRRMDERGIMTRAYFPSIHLQPFFRERLGHRPGDFPHAEAASRTLLALPFHGRMTDADVQLVCDVLAEEIGAMTAGSGRGGETPPVQPAGRRRYF